MNPPSIDKFSSNTAARENFQQKLRSWFQNRGIIEKLVVYLRSQMFIEFQNQNDLVQIPGNNAISSKHQAVKLLVADFLLQENLLFTLSVFCSEVPFLLNLKEYASYISKLGDIHDTPVRLKQPKPKFSKKNVCDIMEALGLHLGKDEVSTIYDLYKSEKSNSFLICLLNLLPMLLKKNKAFQRHLIKIRKKEKYIKRIIKIEKNKVKKMFELLQHTHNIVTRHKTEMNDLLQKHDKLQKNYNLISTKLNELQKKEAELDDKESLLKSKQRDFEKIYESKLKEIENKATELKDKDRELEDKNKNLLDLQKKLESEKDLWLEKTGQLLLSNTNETSKLQEYEQKFRTLQDEVLEILKQCQTVQTTQRLEQEKQINKEIQCQSDIIHQSQQTESDIMNIEEYVNLMEKENSLLKSSSFKQRQYITQLSAEVIFLKNKLDYLEKNLQISNDYKRRKEMNEVAEKLYSPKFLTENILTSSSRSRKQLFPDKSSSEFTSSNSKEDTSFTDEIVADAKNKLKELENESEALNRNFKHLQGVLSRNKAFNDQFSGSDSTSDKLLRKYGTIKSLAKAECRDSESNLDSSPDLKRYSMSKKFSSDTDLAASSPDRKVSFKKMYLKYKERKHEQSNIDYRNISPSPHKTDLDENINKLIKKEILPNEDNQDEKCINVSQELLTKIIDGPSKNIFEKKINADGILESNVEESDASYGKKEDVISVGSSHSKSSSDFWK